MAGASPALDTSLSTNDHLPDRKLLSVGFCLFVTVFALRLFALTRLTESQFLFPTGGDMQFYNEWALRILHGRLTEHTAFYGLPLYAYLLAAIYGLGGYCPFVPGLIQAALEGGTAVLLYKLASRIFAEHEKTGEAIAPGQCRSHRAETIGIMAAMAWAFFQPAQSYSIILMPTAWLVFVFWFVVWQIVRRTDAPGCRALLFLGGLIGFTAMGVATILFLIPLLLAALFIRWRAPVSRRLLSTGLLIAGMLLGASPAWIHNYYLARDPVFLSAHSGVNFWIGNHPGATGYPKFPPGLHAGQTAMLQDSITVAEQSAGHALKRSEVSEYWGAKARSWIDEHPIAWLKLLGVKVTNFWNAYQYDDLSIITTLREQAIIVPGIGFGIIAALAIPGMIIACWRFRCAGWVAAAVFLHMAALLTVFVTERYRLAAVPGLALFAAFALWELWSRLANARYTEACVFVALLFGGTAFVSMPQKDETLWGLDSFNSGLQALEVGRLEAAKGKLDVAYAYSPHNAEVNFAEGNLQLALNDRERARSFYARTLLLDPTHAGAFNNLGVLALQDGRWELAAKFFRHAIEHSPADSKIYYLLAWAELESGKPLVAKEEIARALFHDPGRSEYRRLKKRIGALITAGGR
jgi:tetratricopeptide (TPR) repeat protein